MNTREINGSNWNIRYFFATAIPLAVITVLIPLLAIPTINFLIKRYESFRSVLQWFLFWVSFMLFVAADIRSWAIGWIKRPDGDSPIYITVFSVSFAPFLLQFVNIARLMRRRRGLILDDDKLPGNRVFEMSQIILQLEIWLLVIACIYIGLYLLIGIELLPYLAYFVFKIWRWRQTKTRQRLTRISTVQLERVNDY